MFEDALSLDEAHILFRNDKIFPLKAEPVVELTITNMDVRLDYYGENVSLPFERKSLDADNDWHHIGVSLSDDKYMSFTIDAVEVPEMVKLPGHVTVSLDKIK